MYIDIRDATIPPYIFSEMDERKIEEKVTGKLDKSLISSYNEDFRDLKK